METSPNAYPGCGGDGYQPTAGLFSGNTTYYGGGGGGGAGFCNMGSDTTWTAMGNGGKGGGGKGACNAAILGSNLPTANSGGGGGGGGPRVNSGTGVDGVPGADGVIIIR